MNAPAITTRVADLIRNPNSAMPNEWERSIQKKQGEPVSTEQVKRETDNPEPVKVKNHTVTLSSGDTLDLSPLAQKILEDYDANPQSEYEKSRNERVQRIQQLVQDKQYTLNAETVDNIAQKIVAMLL